MIPQAGSAYAYSLRDAGRAGRVDHRLGPDPRVRGRQRRGGDLVGRLLHVAAPRLRRRASRRGSRPATARRCCQPDPALHGLLDTAPHIAGIPVLVNLPAFAIVMLITWLLLLGVRESATREQHHGRDQAARARAVRRRRAARTSTRRTTSRSRRTASRGIHQGAAIVFFAYIGFDAISTAAEETKNPQRNLPIGILGGLAICTVIYVIVGAVLTGMVPYTELGVADPLAEALNSAGLHDGRRGSSRSARSSRWRPCCSCSSTASRASSSRWRATACCPQWAAKMHPKYRTSRTSRRSSPASFVALWALIGDAGETYDLTNIGTLFAFALVCIGVLVLRYTDPDRPRPFRVPFVWPISLLGAARCACSSWWACRAGVGAVRHLAGDRDRALLLVRDSPHPPAPVSRAAAVKLPTRIVLGLALGATSGIAANVFAPGAPWVKWLGDNVASPVGQIFLRLLIMTVIPLVFASITLGVAGLGDIRKVGRVGARTIVYFLVSTAIAATLGLLLVNVARPGEGLDPAVREQLMVTYRAQAQGMQAGGGTRFGIETFVNMVPRNPIQAAANLDMLGVIVFALFFGAALTLIPPEKARPMLRVLDALGEAIVKIIDIAMRLAPYGVFALVFVVTSRFGWGLLRQLGLYVAVVLIGLALHGAVVLSALVRVLGGLSPAGVLEPHPRQHRDRIFYQLEQCHAPDQHCGGRAGARDSAADRGLRAAARIHVVHERDRAVRGGHGPVPGTGVRHDTRFHDAGGRHDTVRDYRGRHRRCAGWITAVADGRARIGGHPARGHRHHPGRGSHPRHVAHDTQRVRGPDRRGVRGAEGNRLGPERGGPDGAARAGRLGERRSQLQRSHC